jgi:sugar (pentulose or hexulose) kinase
LVAGVPAARTGRRLSEVGELSRAAAEELELPAGLPLVHAAGDAASVTAGRIGATPGAISVSLGTSGWVAALTERPSGPNEAIHHLVGPTGRESLLIGALLSAGATVEWARRTYLPGASRSAAERAAEQAGPTELLMLPSLAGARAPVRGPAGAYRAAASALGLPVPAPLADAVDPVTVLHPGGQREHYDRLADAHGELWALLRPTFRALAGR